MTNFSERTNTLLYKNISHTLFSKGLMLVVCERWVERRGQTAILTSQWSFLSWLGCSTVGHRGPKALCLPLALNSASRLQLTQTVCTPVCLYRQSVRYFSTPNCFRCSSVDLHRCISLQTARSRVNMLQSSHSYFSKFHMLNFFHVRLHPPHTHILQIMLKDNNSKNFKK